VETEGSFLIIGPASSIRLWMGLGVSVAIFVIVGESVLSWSGFGLVGFRNLENNSSNRQKMNAPGR